MKRDRETLPRPRSVMTVPAATVTGAVAMMQTPMTNSGGRAKTARIQKRSGITTREEIMAATGALKRRNSVPMLEVSRVKPVTKKARKIPTLRMRYSRAHCPRLGIPKAMKTTTRMPAKNQFFFRKTIVPNH